MNNPDGKVTISRKLITIKTLLSDGRKTHHRFDLHFFNQEINVFGWSIYRDLTCISDQVINYKNTVVRREKSASFLCYRILISHRYLKIMKWTYQRITECQPLLQSISSPAQTLHILVLLLCIMQVDAKVQSNVVKAG